MSGIYISGLEMPKRGEFSHVRIYDNGEVTIESNGVEYPVAKAVAVTDYGRLIDADALNDLINRSYPMTDRYDVHNGYAICQELIKMLPTIIPADKGGDDDV